LSSSRETTRRLAPGRNCPAKPLAGSATLPRMSKTSIRRPPGRFFVFEGLDGSGTTTQAERLARRLVASGRRAHLTAEPSTGPVGLQLREILAGRLQGGRGQPWDRRVLGLLFAADRLDHWRSEIEPLLAEGVDVVC